MGKKGAKVKCPSCSEEFTLQRVPTLKDTKMTLAVSLEQGHMLQAETLGGTLTSLAKLLKAQAKELGGKVTVLVSDLRIASPDKIEIEVSVLTNPTKAYSQLQLPAVSADGGQGPDPSSESDAKELRPKRGLPGKGE